MFESRNAAGNFGPQRVLRRLTLKVKPHTKSTATLVQLFGFEGKHRYEQKIKSIYININVGIYL